MMDNGNSDSDTAREDKYGRMVAFMKDIGKITKLMARED